MKRRGNDVTTWLLGLPGLLWLLALFVVPTLLVVLIAFKPSDLYGGTQAGWTVAAWGKLWSPGFGRILLRTLGLALLTTLLCLVPSVPCAYFLARQPPQRRNLWLLLVILPFWTSLLVRVLAWKVLLHPEGFFKKVLVWLYLVDANAVLLYNTPTVLLVQVYAFLPFALLPIYAAAEKVDFTLMEAARDLGAGPAAAFFRIFVPAVAGGIWGAVAMVFIPALGSYVIPDLVGGPSSELIGNKIAQRTFTDRNLPLAAALATCLMLAVLPPMLLALGRRRGNREGLY